MRQLLVLAALFIAMAAHPACAVNVMPAIALQFSSCESAVVLGSCGSVVLAQSRTAVGRTPAPPVQSRTMSIIELVVQMECNSIRHLGAFVRTTLRDIGAKLRRR
jgi:hypothetical protein